MNIEQRKREREKVRVGPRDNEKRRKKEEGERRKEGEEKEEKTNRRDGPKNGEGREEWDYLGGRGPSLVYTRVPHLFPHFV